MLSSDDFRNTLSSPIMERSRWESAERIRSALERGQTNPVLFREALSSVPPAERDAWVSSLFGLGELPDDAPELPRGCVPYLPASVDALLRVVEHAPVRESDVFVDIGSGLGRAAGLVHLLSGASVIGLEIQPELVRSARSLADRLLFSRVSYVEGDAAELAGSIATGTVFFLYCPFSGERLAKVMGELEGIARTRTIRVCCLDLPLPPCPWLRLDASLTGGLELYCSRP